MRKKLSLLYILIALVAVVMSGCETGELDLDPNNNYALDWSDGDVIEIKHATKGGDLNGFNIVIMGDGFTENQMDNDGVYEQIMRQAADHILNIEPMKSYADYVNIYSVVVVSEKRGVDAKSKSEADTPLGCYYGEGTEVGGDHSSVQMKLYKVKNLTNAERQNCIVCVVLNDDKHAGTTYFFQNSDFTIAYCPIEGFDDDLFGQLVHHEVVGHGVGRLLDEYVYHYKSIDSKTLAELTGHLESGIGANLSINSESPSWSNFIGAKGYDEVGVFRGGYFYSSGVYRSEYKSCMDDNRAYFNAPSRYAIAKRIFRDSQTPFDYNAFVENDIAKQPSVIPSPIFSFGSRSGDEVAPLYPPQFVE